MNEPSGAPMKSLTSRANARLPQDFLALVRETDIEKAALTANDRIALPLPSQGAHMSSEVPYVVSRYFERDTDRDIDSIVSLFADDATVIDEREEHHGTAEIRAWQTGAASKYTYTTEITNTETLGPDRYLVTGRLTGNFPGGIADLKWDFTIAGQQITRLVIAP
jgi:hypothetical protein